LHKQDTESIARRQDTGAVRVIADAIAAAGVPTVDANGLTHAVLAHRIVSALAEAGLLPLAPAPVAAPPVILIVEDDRIMRNLLSTYVTGLGYSAVEASTPHDAATIAGQGGLSAVLLDLTLAGDGSGLDVARAIRSGPLPWCNAPIIAVTGHSDPATRDQVLSQGFVEVLVKPVSQDKIGATLARYLPILPIDDPRIDGFVLSSLLRDVGHEAAARIVRRFVQETKSSLAGFTQLDNSALTRAAHTLKSTARAFGACRLATLAAALETACKAGEPVDRRAAAAELAAALEDVLPAYNEVGIAV
jgi:CheY-like chemotaxis protein